jgi:hypothetical protein
MENENNINVFFENDDNHNTIPADPVEREQSKEQEQVTQETTVRHIHTHQFLFLISKNKSFWLIIIFSFFAVIFGITSVGLYQNGKRCELNDLKYRYVKMKGGATIEQLRVIEKTFKDPQKITDIRNKVQEYEDLVQRRAELLELEENSRKEKKAVEEKAGQLKNINLETTK